MCVVSHLLAILSPWREDARPKNNNNNNNKIAHSLCWIFNGHVTCFAAFNATKNKWRNMHIIVVKWIMMIHTHARTQFVCCNFIVHLMNRNENFDTQHTLQKLDIKSNDFDFNDIDLISHILSQLIQNPFNTIFFSNFALFNVFYAMKMSTFCNTKNKIKLNTHT